MNLVYQPHNKGCFAACCATLFGGVYEEWDCVGHHHENWRDNLREKTGLDYFEVSANEATKLSPSGGDIYILGVKLPYGGDHVVLAESMDPIPGEPCRFNIFHDPLGELLPSYNVTAVIVLSKIFRMP